MISLSRSCVLKIHRFLELEYPLEGAGLLYGRREGGIDNVTWPVVIKNSPNAPANIVQKEDWFEINPLMMLWIDTDARKEGLTMLGSFHSHPNHPARPSPRDLERAWPDLKYMICTVAGDAASGVAKVREWTCWTLNESGKAFAPVVVNILPDQPNVHLEISLFQSRTRQSLSLPPVVK